MKATIFSEKDNELIIRIKGSNFETINSIRRSCMNNVPTLAIEDVEFSSNNSALYDENLAHRLGLIPLTTDLKSYVKSENCKCKEVGCARCTVQLTLEAKGPCTVYSKELASTDSAIKPVFDDMPIVKLFEGQEVRLIATAKLNNGSYHAKHQPCMSYYGFYPILEKESDLKKLPAEVFKDGIVDKENIQNLTLFETIAEDEKISYSTKDDDVLLTIESWGQLNPKEIYLNALKNLSNDLEDFSKSLK